MDNSKRIYFAIAIGLISLACATIPSSMTAQPNYAEWTAPANLGPVINSGVVDTGPAISKNGLSLYFASGRSGGAGGLDIWVSQRATVDDPWGRPTNLQVVNTASTENIPAFSRDGHWMFFNSNRPGSLGDVDIWASWRAQTHDDFGWQTPVNLGMNVNTMFGDSGVSYFENEEGGAPLIFFSSNRPVNGVPTGGVYVSAQLPDGSFGPSTLVPELSGAESMRPMIRFDGLEIFLFSNRMGTLGARDIWTSVRDSISDPWSTPANLGPVVNTTANEITEYLSADGRELYFSSDRSGGFGLTDLYVTTRIKGHGAKDRD